MLKKKNYIIVGMIVNHNELLRISVPALSRIKQNIYLIICAEKPIKRSLIRKLGWRGKLKIINKNTDSQYFDILSEINSLKIRSDWMLFMNSGDIVSDIQIATVSTDNFAILQNMVFINESLIDLLRVIDNPKNYTVDDKTITILRPNMNIIGTILRTDIMIEFYKEKISTNDDNFWSDFQTYVKSLDKNLSPIYMNTTNYISNNLL